MLNPRTGTAAGAGSRLQLARNPSSQSVTVKNVEESQIPARLGDPCRDRKVPDVLAPYVGHLSDELLFPVEGMPDWQVMIQLFQGEGRLSKEQAMIVVSGALHLLKREPNVMRVNFPATLFGDIHG